MGRGRRDKVHLTVEQRERLEQISRNGYAPAKKILHARILLMCDEGEQGKRKWTDEEIAQALQVHRNTVARIRQRFLLKGEKPALERSQRKTPPTAPNEISGLFRIVVPSDAPVAGISQENDISSLDEDKQWLDFGGYETSRGKDSKIQIELKQLNKHAFICGVPGSGKY